MLLHYRFNSRANLLLQICKLLFEFLIREGRCDGRAHVLNHVLDLLWYRLPYLLMMPYLTMSVGGLDDLGEVSVVCLYPVRMVVSLHPVHAVVSITLV